jgi:hypothetical protein
MRTWWRAFWRELRWFQRAIWETRAQREQRERQFEEYLGELRRTHAMADFDTGVRMSWRAARQNARARDTARVNFHGTRGVTPPMRPRRFTGPEREDL